MLKILHILSQIPAQTGSGIFFQNIVKQCSRAGYEQGAIVGLPKELGCEPIPGLPEEALWRILFETQKLPFKIPGMSDVMPYDSTVFSAMDAVAVNQYTNSFREAISLAIKTFEPSIILSNHLWLATAAACEVVNGLPAGAARPDLYAVCHGTDLRQMQLCPSLAAYVAEECRTLKGVFCLNRHQVQEIHRIYGIQEHRLYMTGSGYDSALFHRGVREKEARQKTELVYAGKLARSKGIYELIQCMALLEPSRYRLTIAGRGSGAEAEEILQAAARSGGDIRYLGQLSQGELAELFRQSDIFVLPSYYEGLPLVVIEALASGMQVVVNDLEGLREWLGDTINDAGRISYVKMPPLEGIDTCSPDGVQEYQQQLAQAIAALPKRPLLSGTALEAYYRAIEVRSWVNVFSRMERVFRA